MKRLQIAIIWLGLVLIGIGVSAGNDMIIMFGYGLFAIGAARISPREIDLKTQNLKR